MSSSILTLTTAASDLSLLTIEEMRAACGIANGASDAKLTVLQKRIAAVIASICNVAVAGVSPPTLRLEVLSETFRVEGSRRRLVLARRPVVEVVSVNEFGTVIDLADVEIDAAAGMLARLYSDTPGWWSCGKIVVAYSAGFATVPDDLKLAASKLAAVMWSEGERVDPNIKAVSMPEQGSVEYWVSPNDDAAVPTEVMDLLTPYMNRPFW